MKSNVLKDCDFKVLKFGKWALLVVALGIIGIVYAYGNSNNTSVMETISSDAGFNILFMIGMINILCFFQLKSIGGSFEKKENINQNIFYLIILLIVQAVTLNYVLVGIIGFSLYSYVNWKNFNLKEAWKYLKCKKLRKNIYMNVVAFTALIGILYTTMFSVIK